MNSYVMDCENERRKGKGRIEIILGPMFSGKTTELIRRIRRFQLSRLKCVVVKYAKDLRYSNTDVITHDSNKIAAVSCLALEDCRSEVMQCDVVGIDEAQFFPDLKNFCEDLANRGKVVVIAGLDGTFQRTAFGEILNLVPLAENVIKLSAICMICFNSASFTKRISEEKTIEIIGGTDKYMSVCRECYHFKESTGNKRSPLKCLTNSVQLND